MSLFHSSDAMLAAQKCNFYSTSPTFGASRNLQKLHNAVLLSRTSMGNGVGLHLVVGPLVADWSWGSLQPGPGVLRLSPSQRGHTVCDPGQQYKEDDNTCIPQTTGAVMFQHLRTLDKVVPVDLCR